MNATTSTRVRELLVASVPRLGDYELRPACHLRDDLEIDSLMMATIAFSLEDEFGFSLVDNAEKFAELQTVQDLYVLLDALTTQEQ